MEVIYDVVKIVTIRRRFYMFLFLYFYVYVHDDSHGSLKEVRIRTCM
jgi:hypothetical protein